MFVLFIVLPKEKVEATFWNFWDGFLQIATKLHQICAWNFTHKAL